MSAKAKSKLTPEQRNATLRRVLHKIKPYSLFVVCSLVVAAVSVAAQLYIPILCGNAIDFMLGKGSVNLSAVLNIVVEIMVVAVAAAFAQWLLSAISREEGESIRLLASVLQEHKTESNSMADALQDYEEYVEGWAHEAKTPLSLLTMLLDNRSNEMSPPLQAKLDYVRSQLQEDVTQMLYYARLKSSTKDYQFKDINLNDCLGEVLEDYAPLLEEKQFVIINKLQSETVYTDRRGLQFMLGQIVSNAIKYSSDSPMLTISMIHSEIADVLSVEDNGIGVKKYDLPYIFQKGFTGDSTDSRKKATGIGLYLVKKMADDLNLRLEAASPWEKGFKIVIFFPKLRSNGGK